MRLTNKTPAAWLIHGFRSNSHFPPSEDHRDWKMMTVLNKLLVLRSRALCRAGVAAILIAATASAKAQPGTLTFASAGIGSSSHMAAERFRLAAKIDVRHVPFKEGGLVQVMNGNVDFYFIPLAAAASALHSDKLTILAVSSPKRVPVLPDTPSVVEAGYPDAVFRFWNGISAPAKTPPDVVKKLHDVTQEALKDPALKDKLAKLGVEPAQISSEEFGKFFKDDLAATQQLAKEAHIEPVD